MVAAFSGVSLSRSCSRHCRELDDRMIADGCHGFKGYVARPANGPFVALFHEDGTDEAGDRSFVGKDSDDIGAALNLAVEAFDGVGTVELRPCSLGKVM